MKKLNEEIFISEQMRGWYFIIKDAIQKMKLMEEKYHIEIGIIDIKEKYGTLRIYAGIDESTISAGTEERKKMYQELYEITDHALEQSETICMHCGSQAVLRDNLSWWLTLCDDCLKEHELSKKTDQKILKKWRNRELKENFRLLPLEWELAFYDVDRKFDVRKVDIFCKSITRLILKNNPNMNDNMKALYYYFLFSSIHYLQKIISIDDRRFFSLVKIAKQVEINIEYNRSTFDNMIHNSNMQNEDYYIYFNKLMHREKNEFNLEKFVQNIEIALDEYKMEILN